MITKLQLGATQFIEHPGSGSDSAIGSDRRRGVTKNVFPSDTQKNPKDCMAVQLRSGREMTSSSAEKKEKFDQKEEKEIGREDRRSNSEQTAKTMK